MKNLYVLFVNLRRLKRENLAAFNAVRNLGYKVAVLSKTSPEEYLDLIDVHCSVDTTDFDQTVHQALELSTQIKIAAVMAYTETSVEITSHIAEKLGLPGLPVLAIKNARNKYAMRESLMNSTNSVAKFVRIVDVQDLNEAIKIVGFPAIIKPLNSSGSTGIFNLANQSDIEYFIKNYHSISNPNYDPLSTTKSLEFILEEYLPGQEICVDGVVYKGKAYPYSVADKWSTEKHYIEHMGIYPSCLSPEVQEAIKNSAADIVKRLGFDNCAFHMEGKITEHGFKFIEVAARPAGDHVMSHLFHQASGECMFTELAKVSLGIEPLPKIEFKYYLALRYLLAEKEGLLENYEGWDKALDIPEIEYIFPEVHVGEKVLLPPNDYRKIKLIAFISKSSNYKKALEAVKKAVNLVKPKIG